MASKTTKRARKAAQQNNAPVEKDDGSRWRVCFAQNHPDTWLRGRFVYDGEGTTKREAQRLSDGLVAPTELTCVKAS